MLTPARVQQLHVDPTMWNHSPGLHLEPNILNVVLNNSEAIILQEVPRGSNDSSGDATARVTIHKSKARCLLTTRGL